MRDAVIVSTARTPIGKAYRGAFNITRGATLGSFSLAAAVERSKVDPNEIDDIVWGCVLTQGTQSGNIGRQVGLRAGLPVGVSAQTIDRQCSSGLMAIATAAKQVVIDRMDMVAAGGQEFDLSGANSRNARAARSRADGDARQCLYAHAANRRSGRQALWHHPRREG